MASTFLTRTIASATGTTKGTFSCWVKRSGLTDGRMFSSWGSSTSQFWIIFQTDKIFIADYDGSYNLQYVTNRLFRDTSAWYHIVVAIDTTLGTSGDRVKLYVNGVQETSFSTSTAPSQNQVLNFSNNGEEFRIGKRDSEEYLDGSMTHIHFTDGYAYDASEFGETDSTSGIWKPKTSPSVTYGNNGFFLKFENSGAMGTDSSGNSNTFTVSGTLTQNVDTPSNNFATLNPLMNPYGGNDSSAFSNGNLSFSNATADYSGLANLGVINGKWYWEIKIVNQLSTRAVGIVRADKISINTTYGFYISDNAAQTDFTASYRGTGLASVKLTGARTTTDTGVTYGTGDIIGIALDLSSVQKTIKYYKNGSIVNTTNLDDSFIDDFILPAFRADATQSMDFNFGQGYFGTTAVATNSGAGYQDSDGNGKMNYSVPSGYKILCTKGINSF